MHSLIIHNGRLGPLDACLSPGQVGLLTGWGVFSTLRIYEGVPFAYELHWKRMSRDAERLRVRLDYDAEEIRGELLRLLAANIPDSTAREAAARIYFVRNTGGYWSAPSDRPTDYLLFTGNVAPWPASLKLTVMPQGRHAAHPLAGAKVLSWVQNVAAVEEAQHYGFDEVVLLNERGEVAECTAANLFAVRQGRLLTPPLDSGCLPGVTRHVLLEVAPRIGLEVREQAIPLDELLSADEALISSTTRELLPVRQILDTKFREDGPVTARLREAFRGYVRDYVRQRAAPGAASGALEKTSQLT